MAIVVNDDDPKKAEMRVKFLTENCEISNEPRWGYFGFPGTLAIGDDSYAPKLMKAPPVESEGEPIRNLCTAPLKKGATPDVYFSFGTPNCIGDLYQDPASVLFPKGKVAMLDPEAPFKPAGKINLVVNKLGYEYVPHMDGVKDPAAVKAKYTDYMPPRNILTTGSKKGGGGVYSKGVLFGFDEDRNALPPHVPDDYDSARKMRKAELAEHQALLQEQPFRSMVYGNKVFEHDTDSYHYDIPTHIPRDPKVENLNSYPHEQPFRPSHPSKKGMLQGCMGGFPEYIEDPLPGGAQRKPAPEGEAPPAFRLGNPRQTVNPMPSVTTMTRNMRAERPSSFARPVL